MTALTTRRASLLPLQALSVLSSVRTAGFASKATTPSSSLSQRQRTIATARSVPTLTSNEEQPTSAFFTVPNNVLLRSLFINTVSSKRWLLSPSIYFMTLLCRPGNSFLLNVNRNKLLAWILKATVYKQFCAGETIQEVGKTMRAMKDMGFKGTMLTYAKETVFDYRTNQTNDLGIETYNGEAAKIDRSVEDWQVGTLETVKCLGEGDQLAVKLTGAGPKVTDAFANGDLPSQQMLDALHTICARCKEQKARVLLDAESHKYLSGILRVGLDLMRKYNTDGHAVVYNTYQAYLKSTPSTVAKHLAIANAEGFTFGLKLVRGAYLATEQRGLIHDTKHNTDNAYDEIAQGALRQELGGFGGRDGPKFPSVNLMLASHNLESVFAAHELRQTLLRQGLPTVPVGFAQLHGMADRVSFKLLQLKRGTTEPEVYKCSTWGSLEECMGYLSRRAAENRDAASRTMDEYKALKAEAWRRLGSFLSLSRK